ASRGRGGRRVDAANRRASANPDLSRRETNRRRADQKRLGKDRQRGSADSRGVEGNSVRTFADRTDFRSDGRWNRKTQIRTGGWIRKADRTTRHRKAEIVRRSRVQAA